MKAVIYCFLVLILLVSCGKENQLPDEYDYLIGEWKCVDSQEPITVQIKKRGLIIIPFNHRKDKIFYNNVHENVLFDGTIFLYINQNFTKSRGIILDIDKNNKVQIGLGLFKIEEYFDEYLVLTKK